MTKANWTLRDPLHGDIAFSDAISRLINVPAVQRLRHIRLSNIDSLGMPGISGITRFEHVLGATSLVNNLGWITRLNTARRLVLEAAVLLHDSGIPPMGHLVEEAMMYTGSSFTHETKWQRLASGDEQDLGGVDLQVYCGRRSGISAWTASEFGTDAPMRLLEIVQAIHGNGELGPLVSGGLDLDNIDNVCRIAYHIGLPVLPRLGRSLAEAIQDCSANGVVFAPGTVHLIKNWLQLRHEVYTHLMLNWRDFAGKLMLLYSTVRAFQSGELANDAWLLTDWQFLNALATAKDNQIAKTLSRWLVGELWATSPLMWFDGSLPTYPEMMDFSSMLSKELAREVFAYRIKDKRSRVVDFVDTDGASIRIGQPSRLWLLGVGSPLKRDFTGRDNQRMAGLASEYFRATYDGEATDSINRPLFTT